MTSTEIQLKEDVREFTGYTSEQVLSTDGLDTAFRAAQRHIRVRKALSADYNWFDTDNPARQEALFWYTCLFAKVQAGELDAQGVQAGAIDHDTLLAKDDNDVTTWYRNATQALNALNATSIIQSTTPSRDEREYTTGTFAREDGVGGDDGSTDGPSI